MSDAQGRTPKVPTVVDHLLAASWLCTGGVHMERWGQAHTEVLHGQVPVIGAFHVQQHWIPVVLLPIGTCLHAHIWDAISHDDIATLLTRLGASMGFTETVVQQDKRLFFSTELCGALAITFVWHLLLGIMLPTCAEETLCIHQKLKAQTLEKFQTAQITMRPGFWGRGNVEETSEDEGTGPSHPLVGEHPAEIPGSWLSICG